MDSVGNQHHKNMKQLIESYCKNDDIYVSRTLDQSYYEMMEDTLSRDKDQVAYRFTTRRTTSSIKNVGNIGKEKEIDPATSGPRILMINQFWLWKIDQSKVPFIELKLFALMIK